MRKLKYYRISGGSNDRAAVFALSLDPGLEPGLDLLGSEVVEFRRAHLQGRDAWLFALAFTPLEVLHHIALTLLLSDTHTEAEAVLLYCALYTQIPLGNKPEDFVSQPYVVP